MRNSSFVRGIRRVTGISWGGLSFFVRESQAPEEFSRKFHDETSQANKDTVLEHFIKAKAEANSKEIAESHASAENFLLLANTAALAGVFTLFEKSGIENLNYWQISPVAAFFLSLLFLGISKWLRIKRAHFISGESYKNTIRFFSGRITPYEMIVNEYAANGKISLRPLAAILSFISFIAGWICLFFVSLQFTTGETTKPIHEMSKLEWIRNVGCTEFDMKLLCN